MSTSAKIRWYLVAALVAIGVLAFIIGTRSTGIGRDYLYQAALTSGIIAVFIYNLPRTWEAMKTLSSHKKRIFDLIALVGGPVLIYYYDHDRTMKALGVAIICLWIVKKIWKWEAAKEKR